MAATKEMTLERSGSALIVIARGKTTYGIRCGLCAVGSVVPSTFQLNAASLCAKAAAVIQINRLSRKALSCEEQQGY
jgi:hypothetical protein